MTIFRAQKKWVRSVFVVLGGLLVIVTIFRVTEAGSLTPPGAPSGTMNTVEEVYAPLASTAYSSASITADRNGSAIEIAKCIIARVTGGSCP